jgi:putative MATE family efflux protein
MADPTVITEKTDYTEGSILGSILKMGLPSMFGFLAQNIYGLINTYWVSRLPAAENAVAGITFFNNLLWFLFAFNHLIGPGSVAIISRRYGEKEYDKAEKAIKETIVLKLGFGIIFGIVGFFMIRSFLELLGATGEALELGVEYGKIIMVGLPINYSIYSIFTALRGVANPHKAMALMFGMTVLNIILDPLLMFGWFGLPAMGMRGAAIASVITFTVIFSIGVAIFFGPWTNVRLHLKGKERMSFDSMWILIRIGIPAWIGDMSFSLSRLLITPMIAGFGTAVVAAYGVGQQVTAFGIMSLVGIGLGLSSLIGHTVGSGKPERAKKTADKAIFIGVGLMSVIGILVYFLARPLMEIFFTHAETVQHGTTLLQIFAFGFPFLGGWLMTESIFGGVGHNTPNMVINIIHSWGFQVIPVLIATQFFGGGELTVWWILNCASVLSFFAYFTYYQKGTWLKVKV